MSVIMDLIFFSIRQQKSGQFVEKSFPKDKLAILTSQRTSYHGVKEVLAVCIHPCLWSIYF